MRLGIVCQFGRSREITLVGTSASVHVRGNAEMLGRAIRNLGENAIRHTSPGSTVEFVVNGNGTVSVLDNGPGISDEERDFIFQRFWRQDRGMPGHTGLGLPIVQGIAELHAATVTFINRKPRGTCFSIKFARPIN